MTSRSLTPRITRPEPLDLPLALSLSKDDRLAQDVPVEARPRALVVRRARHERSSSVWLLDDDDDDDDLDDDEDDFFDTDEEEDGDEDQDDDEDDVETWQVREQRV